MRRLNDSDKGISIILFMFLLVCFAVSCSVGDDTSPGEITDLTVSSNSKILNWTSPGDDNNSGQARINLIRYYDSDQVASLLNLNSLNGVSEQEINNAVRDNFNKAIQVPQFFTPAPAGEQESVAVPRIDLTGQNTYYFAVATNDEVGNMSPPSNVVKVTTPLAQASIQSNEQSSCLGISATSAEVGGKSANEDDSSEFIKDLIVGDPCANRVYIFYGGGDIIGDASTVDVNQADVTIIGPPGESFGKSVLGLGDFAERATFEEFIIGAPDADNGAGKGYIFYGKEDLPSVINLNSGDEADSIVAGENPGDHFGFSFATRGENDLLVGAPGALNNRGIVYRFIKQDIDQFKNASNAKDIIYGETGQGMFGYDVSGGGNINNSSPLDYIISAPGLERVYIIFDTGNMDLSQNLSDVLVINGSPGDRFGESIAGGYDIDGVIPDDDDNNVDLADDADVVIGAPGVNNGAGAVYFYDNEDIKNAHRDGTPISPAATINGSNQGDNLGAAVAVITDFNPIIQIDHNDEANVMNQDQTDADIVVGAPGSGEGKVFIFFGEPGFSGMKNVNQANITLTPQSGSSAFGSYIFSIDDVNHDLFNDIAIGNSDTIVVTY